MRGESTKKEIIGHTVYGDLNGVRFKWHFNLKDKIKAESAGAALGMKNLKSYAIHSDNPLPVLNDGHDPTSGDQVQES